jgi:hypothetical protein
MKIERPTSNEKLRDEKTGEVGRTVLGFELARCFVKIIMIIFDGLVKSRHSGENRSPELS